jgi:hypothetical protein
VCTVCHTGEVNIKEGRTRGAHLIPGLGPSLETYIWPR